MIQCDMGRSSHRGSVSESVSKLRRILSFLESRRESGGLKGGTLGRLEHATARHRATTSHSSRGPVSEALQGRAADAGRELSFCESRSGPPRRKSATMIAERLLELLYG